MLVDPRLSTTKRMVCVPAVRLTVATTSAHACQPPVFGTDNGPVTLTPPTSTWNVPPGPLAATRAVNLYEPAAATETVYFNHSPRSIQPTSKPPPPSLVCSTSTSSVRY